MVDSSKLMVGNWVSLDGKNVTVKSILGYKDSTSPSDIVCSSGEYKYNCVPRELKPIIITPQILEASGFQKTYTENLLSGRVVYRFHELSCGFYKDHCTMWFNSYVIPSSPQTVHELQNLSMLLLDRRLNIKL